MSIPVSSIFSFFFSVSLSPFISISICTDVYTYIRGAYKLIWPLWLASGPHPFVWRFSNWVSARKERRSRYWRTLRQQQNPDPSYFLAKEEKEEEEEKLIDFLSRTTWFVRLVHSQVNLSRRSAISFVYYDLYLLSSFSLSLVSPPGNMLQFILLHLMMIA